MLSEDSPVSTLVGVLEACMNSAGVNNLCIQTHRHWNVAATEANR